MKRSASAVWKGGLQDGKGTVSTESGTLSNVPYDFKKRFENEKGTNPEELVAAAHAACFSMALSKILADAGMTAESIGHDGHREPRQGRRGISVTSSHLDTTVKIPNAKRPRSMKRSKRPRPAVRFQAAEREDLAEREPRIETKNSKGERKDRDASPGGWSAQSFQLFTFNFSVSYAPSRA